MPYNTDRFKHIFGCTIIIIKAKRPNSVQREENPVRFHSSPTPGRLKIEQPLQIPALNNSSLL